VGIDILLTFDQFVHLRPSSFHFRSVKQLGISRTITDARNQIYRLLSILLSGAPTQHAALRKKIIEI
jgi:hypothetical protein